MSDSSKPLIFIVFDPQSRKYLSADSKWTRFAEDAIEYRTYAVAAAGAGRIKEGLTVVSAISHYRPKE